jgi:Fic family protein
MKNAGPKGYEGGITTRKHERILQTSRPTAAQDLIQLERIGLLKNTVRLPRWRLLFILGHRGRQLIQRQSRKYLQ